MSELRDYEKETRSSRELAEIVPRFIGEDGTRKEDSPLAALHHRGGREEFEIGAEFAASPDPVHRMAGAMILAELGWGEQRFHEESVDILISLLGDSDFNVVAEAASALGHRKSQRALTFLAELKDHPEAEVRRGVVSGVSCQNDPLAISCLISLMKDEDRDVRNWAVFGLGSLCQTDTREICEALFEALDEEDDEIHGEAMVGLAFRGDRRVVQVLLDWWETEEPFGLALEAAEAIADPRLAPRMERLLKEMDGYGVTAWKRRNPYWRDEELPRWREELVKALESCRGAPADF